MIHAALGRPVPVELTNDPHVRGRVSRLTAVSLVALGLVAWLAATTLQAPGAVVAALAVGWVTMPAVLALSLIDPRARYLLAVPSTLVTLGLVGVCALALPASATAAAGWVLVTTGVVVGATLGLWLWYRLAPVPDALDDPLARGRWALIAVHVGLVAAGLALAATAVRL